MIIIFFIITLSSNPQHKILMVELHLKSFELKIEFKPNFIRKPHEIGDNLVLQIYMKSMIFNIANTLYLG